MNFSNTSFSIFRCICEATNATRIAAHQSEVEAVTSVRQWTSDKYEYVIVCNFPHDEINRATIDDVIVPSMRYASFERLKLYCGDFSHLAATVRSDYDVMYNLNQVELCSAHDPYPTFSWFLLDAVADRVSVEFAAAKHNHVVFAGFSGLLANNTEARCRSFSYEVDDVSSEGSDDVTEAVRLANDVTAVSPTGKLLVTTIYTND